MGFIYGNKYEYSRKWAEMKPYLKTSCLGPGLHLLSYLLRSNKCRPPPSLLCRGKRLLSRSGYSQWPKPAPSQRIGGGPLNPYVYIYIYIYITIDYNIYIYIYNREFKKQPSTEKEENARFKDSLLDTIFNYKFILQLQENMYT